MLTGKQRSYLKSIANRTKPIMQIGKAGITDSFLQQLELALESREIVKINILENSDLNTKEAASTVAEAVDGEFVQAIGNKIVIYKESKNNKKIELPKS